MAEQLAPTPNLYAEQPAFATEEVMQDGSSGVESDDSNPGQRFVESALANHMERYDGYVSAAHDFIKDKLGMTDVQDSERAVVLPSQVAESWGVGSVGGGYLPDLGIAYVFEPKDERQKTAKIKLASSLVHELAHSASVSPENAQTEHAFYHEAIAGMAEYFALQNLSNAGEFKQAPDCTVTRVIDGQDIKIVVPGSFRRVDAQEVVEGQADTTQALIAAMVVGIGLNRTGKKASEILSMTKKGDAAAYTAIKEAVEAIEPGFQDYITSQAYSTDTVIKIAQHAQEVTGMSRLAS